MLISMTGFSRKSENFPWGTLTLEISSVNHRYQEISARLPRELLSMEPVLVAKMRSLLGRGKTRLNVEVLWNPEYKMATIDETLLSGYWRQLNKISETLGSEQKISLTGLLNLPGVCDSQRSGDLEKEIEGAMSVMLEGIVKTLDEMKKGEGAALARDISSQLDNFSEIIDKVEHDWQSVIPEALAAVRAKLEKFLAEAGQGIAVEPSRLAQEVALLSDKWDISEEIVRSRSHIEKFLEIMSDAKISAGAGRKLDFLIQEMNREINTMGSKMQNAALRWLVVEAKASLERIREQIQNID